ncbi:MAG: energy transducer TonB [bacterium]
MKKMYFVLLLLAVLSATVVAQQAGDDENTPPPEYVPYDKAPEPVKMVQPKYPSIAIQKKVQGTVWVSMWVTKSGVVKKVDIAKTDSPFLNQAAIDAAMQWTFTPATIRNLPVAVWVKLPFKFRL